jgi:hypothetical protein
MRSTLKKSRVRRVVACSSYCVCFIFRADKTAGIYDSLKRRAQRVVSTLNSLEGVKVEWCPCFLSCFLSCLLLQVLTGGVLSAKTARAPCIASHRSLCPRFVVFVCCVDIFTDAAVAETTSHSCVVMMHFCHLVHKLRVHHLSSCNSVFPPLHSHLICSTVSNCWTTLASALCLALVRACFACSAHSCCSVLTRSFPRHAGFGQRDGTFHFRTTFLPQENQLDPVMDRMSSFHSNFLKK